jgi:hypothetical protein
MTSATPTDRAHADDAAPHADTTPSPPILPDRDHLHAVLSDTERRLNPANPEIGGHLTVLAYGEISAALTTEELPGLVCKRMAGFPDEASVSTYLDLVDEYLMELAAAGLSVAPTEVVPVHRPGRPPVVYLVQPRMDPQSLGHRQLRATDDAGLATVMRQVLDSVARLSHRSAGRTDGVEVALDGQLSNWSFSATAPASPPSQASAEPVVPESAPTQPVLIDVGTPFIRRHGRHSLDARVILAPAPPGIRALLLRFVADSYQDDYFVPRTVALDLLGNFHKEGAPNRIGTGLEIVNEWLASSDIPGPRDPITPKEVDDYYRQDARLLGIFLQARRADRAIRTKVLRRPYDFLLPGKVAR